MLSRRPLICTLVTVSVASAFALDELTESPPPSLSEVRGCALAGALQDVVNATHLNEICNVQDASASLFFRSWSVRSLALGYSTDYSVYAAIGNGSRYGECSTATGDGNE